MEDEDLFSTLRDALVDGNLKIAEETVQKILDAGYSPERILEEMTKAMQVVSDKWKKMEIFLADVMTAADAMKAGVRMLEPILRKDQGKAKKGKVVIGTVFGDIHDIGKNIVGIMLEVDGFEVIDLGHDVEPKAFVKKAQETNADIIGLSSLMTTTLPFQRDVIRLLIDQNLRENYRVIVGGGTTSPDWAKEIGADGYGRTGPDAVDVANQVIKGDKRIGSTITVGG